MYEVSGFASETDEMQAEAIPTVHIAVAGVYSWCGMGNCGFILMPDANWETQSFYLMPFPMTLMFPIALNLASMLEPVYDL